MFVVLLGPPGAGKGTQATILAARLGLAHIATGNLLREAVQRGTPTGKLAQGYLDRGEYVPDEVVLEVVRQRLDEPDASRGVVFDGYPRTRYQAEALDRELARRGHRIERAVDITVTVEALIARLGSRRTCPACGATYNEISNPPAEPGICDACGESLVCRSDDSPPVIRRRLQVYRQEAGPVEDYYAADGRLAEVDGLLPTDAVTAAIEAIVCTAPAAAAPRRVPARS